MFWLDEIVDDIIKTHPDKKEFIIRDEKTLSGRVHVGSLRGVVIHGLVAQALNERGLKTRFIFEYNDADPMDGLPVYLDKNVYTQHMGKPLKDVPAPAGTNAKDYPTYFGDEFLAVIHKIGFFPEITRASERYAQGDYDEWIDKVLRQEDKIRAIYREVSGSEKPEDWHPLQIVCEKCGKVGTTKVTSYDGKEVEYVCLPDMVKWAVGCGNKGKCSPFKGRGKLPWKVEWPVKWAGYHIDIEGAGKDHCAAGGSRDVGERIARNVLGIEPPYNIPYEFFLFEGAKMSSSKGMGATAHEMAESMPPELLRFLITKIRPQSPINFNADGDTIPRLFDEYDKAARVSWGEEEGLEDLKRLFHFTQVESGENEVSHYLPRFSRIAFFKQLPHLNIVKECEKLKGEPLTVADVLEIETRMVYCDKWLENYAPDSAKFEVAENEIPARAAELTDTQKQVLLGFADVLETFQNEYPEDSMPTNQRGEALHAKIHEYRKQTTLEPRDAFSAIYMSLIGKDSGPQAGWFLETLDPQFVITRFREVSGLKAPEKKEITTFETKHIHIVPEVQTIFPGLVGGVAIIKNVKIKSEDTALEALKTEVLAGINAGDLKKNSTSLQEYKSMYKKFGVDPTKRKPSPVALIDRLANGKDFPKINTVVDAYNLAVVKNQVSCGAFNLSKMTFPVTLRFAEHGEMFQALLEDHAKSLQKGELIYADATGLVIAQDYNYRDSEITRVDESVTDLFVQVDGNAATSLEQVTQALEDTCAWITQFSGGEVTEKYTFEVK